MDKSLQCSVLSQAVLAFPSKVKEVWEDCRNVCLAQRESLQFTQCVFWECVCVFHCGLTDCFLRLGCCYLCQYVSAVQNQREVWECCGSVPWVGVLQGETRERTRCTRPQFPGPRPTVGDCCLLWALGTPPITSLLSVCPGTNPIHSCDFTSPNALSLISI